MKTLAAIIGVVILALPAGAACAQNDGRPRSVAVSHADLDLTTEAGRATLDNRIDAAVRRVC